MTYKPDFFITMADIGTHAGYIDNVIEAKKRGWRGLWIAYSYLDSHSWEKLYWNKILEMPDINLVMADHGELEFKKHNIPKIKIIKAGVDTKLYFPLANKEELKIRYGLQNKFVIGFVGKNQRRKMLPNLIKAYSQFSKDKTDVILLLHTEENSSLGWDLNCVAAKYEEFDPDLQKKIKFTRSNFNDPIRQLIQTESMNEIYNLMDYECHAVGGEGFGLPCIECQASGVPLIMTDYSTGLELTEQSNGILIPVLKDEYNRLVQEIGANGIENAIPDDIALSKIFEEIYIDWKSGGIKLKERQELSRKFSLKYDWDLLIPKWIELFENA
jgi:glycosyltransferase involved in cell wall biosynthesis